MKIEELNEIVRKIEITPEVRESLIKNIQAMEDQFDQEAKARRPTEEILNFTYSV